MHKSCLLNVVFYIFLSFHCFPQFYEGKQSKDFFWSIVLTAASARAWLPWDTVPRKTRKCKVWEVLCSNHFTSSPGLQRSALHCSQCCPYIYTLYLIRYINKVFYIYTLYLMPFPVILLELGWWQNAGPESLIDQILSCCLVLLRNKSVQISSVDSTVGKCVRYSMPKEVKCALTWEMSAGWRSPHVEKEKATTSKNGRKL